MAKKKGSRRNAPGAGNIRKKIVHKNGQEYVYWEARLTVGFDPGTGKQIQRSFTGKTQKEVRERLQAAAVEVNTGTYTEPCKITLGEWLDLWAADYLGGVKPFTVASYTGQIRNHIKPALGAVKLEALNTNTIQRFYNSLGAGTREKPALSPKTIKNIHGVLHKALQQAVAVGYLRFNPSEACILPRVVRKELSSLGRRRYGRPAPCHSGTPDGNSVQGHALYRHAGWGGPGTQVGLCQFSERHDPHQQAAPAREEEGRRLCVRPLKNDKARMITPASAIMDLLKRHREAQRKQRALIGEAWVQSGLVFTNDLGQHLATHTVYTAFKRIVTAIGRPDVRFHDLRHSYAVAAIRSGDDIKTVRDNLGHATAAFTLDIYGHVTDQMTQESAARMESYTKDVLEL